MRIFVWIRYLLILSTSTWGSSFKYWIDPSGRTFLPGLMTMKTCLKNWRIIYWTELTIPTWKQYSANFNMLQSLTKTKVDRASGRLDELPVKLCEYMSELLPY